MKSKLGKKEILDLLKRYKEQYAQQHNILAMGVFGSVARDEAKTGSDVDIVVSISKPDFFMLAGIKNELEEMLHRPVDIVTYGDTTSSFLKKRIDRDVIYV